MDFSEIQAHFSPYARIQRVYGDFLCEIYRICKNQYPQRSICKNATKNQSIKRSDLSYRNRIAVFCGCDSFRRRFRDLHDRRTGISAEYEAARAELRSSRIPDPDGSTYPSLHYFEKISAGLPVFLRDLPDLRLCA